MIYDKIRKGNNIDNMDKSKIIEISNESIVSDYAYRRKEDEDGNARILQIDQWLNNLAKIYPDDQIRLESYKNALEAEEDDPFGAAEAGDVPVEEPVGDDGGAEANFDSDPFGADEMGGMDFGSDFNDASFDSAGDNMFGDDPNQDPNAPTQNVIDRTVVKLQEYNISKQIRNIFPQRLLDLKNIIDNNIEAVEHRIYDNPLVGDVLRDVVKEYRYIYTILEEFIKVLPDKTYEDIVEAYVQFHSSLYKLRQIVKDIASGPKKS